MLPTGPPRPSPKEMAKKVRDALTALRAGNCRVAVDKHVAMSLEFLDCDAEELWQVLEELLEELLKAGPAACYVGGRPPQRSYEAGFTNDELWAYRWNSQVTGADTYLKFVIKREWLFFFDCHEHKEAER